MRWQRALLVQRKEPPGHFDCTIFHPHPPVRNLIDGGRPEIPPTELSSRGLEFLFSRNRLNVAVSRAMHTAYVVYSTGLLDDLPRTPEGVARLSAFARLVGADRSGGSGTTAPTDRRPAERAVPAQTVP